MGMAASQARFLSLTARKSNTEYEGQQINQERTALANESSNLYAQLTKLDVPTPPATSDFYKTTYSFVSSDLSGNKTQLKYTLDTIQATPDGDVAILSHKVNHYQNRSVLRSGSTGIDSKYPAGTITDVSDKNTTTYDSPYNVQGGILSGMLFDTGEKQFAIYLEPVEGHESTLNSLAGDHSSADYISKYDFGDGKGEQEYLSYIVIDNQKYYFTNGQLINQQNEDYDKSYVKVEALSNIQQVSKTVTEEFNIERYETNANGRITTITVNVDGEKFTYELDCIRTQDEEAYEQAMLDYEYYQAKYEKTVSDINSKTEAIQQKDKTLELELKQLDTEQNAIKTEMDAVQKVVEDNVDSTFKTFG